MLRDRLNKVLNVIYVDFIELDGFDAIVLLMRAENVLIDEMVDEYLHLGAIDVIGKFANIPKFSDHVPESFVVDFFDIKFIFLLF